MKKIIALGIFVILLVLATKMIVWGQRFVQDAAIHSSNGRINVLVLGIGGGDHEGADLTDTMMVVSLDTASKSMAMISIPRDIWSDTLKDRVNSAYHYGGLLMAKVISEDVVGIPIHYAFVLDFSGFKEVIDAVGGLDVNVPTAFTDTEYPCEKDTCVYETIHFNAGAQHMDGARALMYTRSRHAAGDEGTDFARGKRQQEIMLALKNRIMHPWQWASPSRITALQSVLQKAVKTDMSMTEGVTIGKKYLRVDASHIVKISIEDKLESPPSYVYGRYVLVPKEDWSNIHSFIKAQIQISE